MKRFWFLIILMAGCILVFFGLAMALELPFLGDDDAIKELNGPFAMGVGVLLLTLDVLLPVPSSLIMITNGALFGILGGALLSLIGSCLSMLFGWWIGKLGKGPVERFIGKEGLEDGNRFLEQWGNLAVVITRPIPVLSETMSILCGSMNFPKSKMLGYGFLGLLPTCLLYAYTGHLALTFDAAWQSFLLVMFVAALVWGIGKWIKSSNR